MRLRQHPSPNFGPRRGGATPRFVVLHYTGMISAEAALARLCDPSAEVSAHYLIEAGGGVLQLVDERQRAWHAGAGQWRGQGDINSCSVGIELDNLGTHPFSDPQMQALEGLLPQIMARWDIPPENIIGHSDMAPGRKTDPGPRFDWARLERQGLAARRGRLRRPAGAAPDFVAAAAQAGFTCPCRFEDLLAATRLRFAPWRQGPLQPDDFIF